MGGPLSGIRVVEIAGIGPAPHACMTLADLGAEVIRIDRPGGGPFDLGAADVMTRGRPSVALDLKQPAAIQTVLQLIERAQVLVEGLRPGAMERLGLGPQECLARNPRLVYGRMTGWGQTGPLAATAGHDLTYLALSGVLHQLGQDQGRPHFPANLLGDFGAGSSYLVIGVLAALLSAGATGRGQVVDAAIVDGAVHLDAIGATFDGLGQARTRGAGLLTGGVPYYDLYETADGRHLAVAALEPHFYQELIDRLGLTGQVPDRDDPTQTKALRRVLGETIRSRPLAEWAVVFADGDACAAPVLTPDEAAAHPHLAARASYVESRGRRQPAPAPRFAETPAELTTPPRPAGADTREALTAWGIDDVDALIESGAAVQA